jgi:ribosome-binding factor A
MDELRQKRVEELLSHEIGSLIVSGEVKDPRVNSFLSVSRVEAARDFSFARVFVSTFQDSGELEAGVAGLNSAAPFIQSRIGKKLKMRLTPRLRFEADRGIREGMDIIAKMKDL